MNDNVHNGHRERVRRRVASEGLRALEPHEVIEFLLYYVFQRQDVNAIAHRLIEKFGNVASVLHASEKELQTVKGVGERASEFLVQVGKVMDACDHSDPEDRICLARFDSAAEYMKAIAGDIPVPSSRLMCLDMESRIVYQREITPSLSWGEPETLRDVMSDILTTRARCVIIAQFGASEIGSYDIACAREFAFILHECGIMLLDVVLIHGTTVQSMRRRGLIPELGERSDEKQLCENYLKPEQLL